MKVSECAEVVRLTFAGVSPAGGDAACSLGEQVLLAGQAGDVDVLAQRDGLGQLHQGNVQVHRLGSYQHKTHLASMSSPLLDVILDIL